MKEFINRGIAFTRKNPTIIFSLLLIFAVTGVIVFNTLFTLREMQKSIDRLLRSKAIIAEDIIALFVRESFDDLEYLQQKIDEIKNTDSEVREISVLVSEKNNDGFKIIVSTNEPYTDTKINGIAALEMTTAWLEPAGAAMIKSDDEGRYWSVVKSLERSGEKVGLLSFSMSLSEYDQIVEKAIVRVYLVSLLSLSIVLLLIANHARLFSYALRVTRLEEIDQMKDDFISMASHELKTPLTAIRGHVELVKDSLKKTTNNDEDVENIRYLDNIDISANRLAELVNDILDVSRIEQDRVPIALKEFDVGKVIDRVIEEMLITAKNKGIELSFNSDVVQLVLADADRARQILVNLVGNAIKYTPKGSVTVKIKEDAKFVSIVVADTGLGISSENLANLFAKFYRVKNDQTSKISGTGLGLWISRELARKMKGDIVAESIEGVGSHFTLKLRKK